MIGLPRVYALLLCCLLPLPALAEGDTLVLGQISDDPKTHYQRLKPLLDYVVPRMRDVGISDGRILMAKSEAQMASYMRSGRVDWVSETAASGIWLQQRADAVPILLTKRSGVSRYASLFFVRRDSRIRSLDDLRGGNIAFQNPSSTSAYYAPAYELLSRGMKLEIQISPLDRPKPDMVGYVFARTERNIATWVVKGLVDAGVMSNIDWQDPQRMPKAFREKIRPIGQTESFPRAMELVSNKMRPQVRERLKTVLMDAGADPAAAKALAAFFGTTGFEPLEAKDLKQMRYLNAAVQRVRKDVE